MAPAGPRPRTATGRLGRRTGTGDERREGTSPAPSAEAEPSGLGGPTGPLLPAGERVGLVVGPEPFEQFYGQAEGVGLLGALP